MLLDLGLLVLRVVLGLIFIGHGGQKLFGWYGGSGWQGWTAGVGKMGLRPAWFWGLMAVLGEFGGGILVLLGLLSPLGSLGIIAAMLMAIIKVHWPKGFWNSKGGIEFPLMNLAAALALGLMGPGAYSVDAALGISLPEPVTLVGGLILVILGVIAALLSRATRPAQTTQATQATHRSG
jgi:putative oxidoreductase